MKENILIAFTKLWLATAIGTILLTLFLVYKRYLIG